MANWWKNVRSVKHSKGNRRRFLDSFDMSEAKRAEAILNSRIKRGEINAKFNRYICECGCGASGCMIVGEYGNNINKE